MKNESCDSHVTVMWQSCDSHVTVMWQSCDSHVTVMWQSCDSHVVLKSHVDWLDRLLDPRFFGEVSRCALRWRDWHRAQSCTGRNQRNQKGDERSAMGFLDCQPFQATEKTKQKSSLCSTNQQRSMKPFGFKPIKLVCRTQIDESTRTVRLTHYPWPTTNRYWQQPSNVPWWDLTIHELATIRDTGWYRPTKRKLQLVLLVLPPTPVLSTVFGRVASLSFDAKPGARPHTSQEVLATIARCCEIDSILEEDAQIDIQSIPK